MTRWLKLLVLWFSMGCVYYLIEIVYRSVIAGQITFPHPSMIIVGGLCGISVGAINQLERFYDMRIRTQAVIGAVLTLVIEFIAGCVLNLWMGLNIWDYSGQPFNIMGQVCVLFGVIWYCIMPFAIWLEDKLRLDLNWNGKAYSLRGAYLDWFLGR